MSPWNYPLLLTIDPLADAIAAGNTAIVKPSAYSPATSNLIDKMIKEMHGTPKYTIFEIKDKYCTLYYPDILPEREQELTPQQKLEAAKARVKAKAK